MEAKLEIGRQTQNYGSILVFFVNRKMSFNESYFWMIPSSFQVWLNTLRWFTIYLKVPRKHEYEKEFSVDFRRTIYISSIYVLYILMNRIFNDRINIIHPMQLFTLVHHCLDFHNICVTLWKRKENPVSGHHAWPLFVIVLVRGS
jgi:hypothetical protein